MKNKKPTIIKDEFLSMQKLGEIENLSVEAVDEKVFKTIKEVVPDVQENSLHEVNFYITEDAKDKAAKCTALIAQGLKNTTKYQAQLDSSDEYGVIISFMEFPYNLDEIKKCSKFISECAIETGCLYDGWEMGFKGNKK